MNDPEFIPGLTRNMSFADYLAIDAVNSHSVIAGSKYTMRHMQAHRRGELSFDETDDLRFGRAMHHKILEPDTFDASWPVAATCCAEIGSGKSKGQKCGKSAGFCTADRRFWFCGTHAKPVDAQPAGDHISEDESTRIENIIKELANAGHLKKFRRAGWSEVVIEFDFMGVKCKARLDRLSLDGPSIIDCKKCRVGHADQKSFSRSVWDYGYHIQAAFYSLAVKAAIGEWPLFTWMIIEDKPPHCVNVIDASDFDLRAGRFCVETTLSQWKRCIDSTARANSKRIRVFPRPQSTNAANFFFRNARDVMSLW